MKPTQKLIKNGTSIERIQVDEEWVWQWTVTDNGVICFGGLCATQHDAENDALIMQQLTPTARRKDTTPTPAKL